MAKKKKDSKDEQWSTKHNTTLIKIRELLLFAFCPKRFLNQMIFKVVSGVT
jgi:hypothetical protein